MLSAELEFWQEAIAAWDGEDEGRLQVLLDAIRSAMEVDKRDFASAHALSTDLLRHDLEPLTRAQVYLYTALTGPGDHAKIYLDVAMDNIELAVETDGEDPSILFWKERIAKVQARLKPVESAPEDVSRDSTAAAREAALPFRSASSKKGKKSQLPNLLKPKAPTVAEPFVTTDGARDVKPGETSTQTTEEARLKDIEAQLAKRVQDQKRRQNLGRLPAQQRRAAANKSFRMGGGTVGTLKGAPSKDALFDLFKKQESEGQGSSEHAAGPKLVVDGEAGMGSKEESRPASVHEEAEGTGGVKMMVDESGDTVIDWAAQYESWVQSAGVADSEEEWEKMNAQTMEQMRAHQRSEARAFDESVMDERGMGFE